MKRPLFAATLIMFASAWDCDTPDPISAETCITTRFNTASDRYGITSRDPSGEPPPDPGCSDSIYEPNEDITRASTSDHHECEDNVIKVGHIDGELDVDVYRTGVCDSGLIPDIPGDVTTVASFETDELLRLCVFPMCHGGATMLSKESSANPDRRLSDNSPLAWATRLQSGFRGFCRVGRGTLTVKYRCPQGSKVVDTYFWVDAGSAGLTQSCPKYTLTFTAKD
jgi:hypothetical protein